MQKTYLINGEDVAVENLTIQDGEVCFELNGKAYQFAATVDSHGHFVLRHNGRNREGFVGKKGASANQPIFLHGGVEATIAQRGRKGGATDSKGAPHTAPMPGTVQKLLVKAGDAVEAGTPLVVMEAMKLQLTIEAAFAGTVEELCCEAGGLVGHGDLLVKVEKAAK
jgi:biotin carboxyl carrier protein